MDNLVAEPQRAPAAERRLTSPVRVSEHPQASRVLVHFSDTHLVAGDELLYGQIDSDRHLREALAELEGAGLRPDAFIFTGDLADQGQLGAYDTLRRLVEPVAARMGAEIIWLMGNHDDRGAFRHGLYDQIPDTSPVDAVYDLDGLRVITLDTSVPGHHHGQLTGDQLDWLAAELATPAVDGTILALHHPPLPAILDLAVSVELYDQHLLADVIRGTDVRTILAGHLHYSSTGMFAGIPVSVASATCYTQDLTAPVGGTRPRDGAQAFNLVHIYRDTIVHSVVPIGRGPAMSFITAEESRLLLGRDGIVIRD